VRRYRFLFNNQKDALIIHYPNLFCHKTLHVSGNFFAHHQEFSTVYSAVVRFMQVLMTGFQAVRMEFHPDSAWKPVIKTCTKLTNAECTVENS
jgi:hypothetical protein